MHVLAASYQGKKLNSPNDIIVVPGEEPGGDAGGSFIFTDPHYGLLEGLGGPAAQEQPCRGVYLITPGRCGARPAGR